MKKYEIDEIVDISRLVGSTEEKLDCEFHEDSGSAYVENNHYICSCCGADLVPSQYLAQSKGISRDEALAFLYRIEKMPIPEWLGKMVKPKINAFKIHSEISERCHEELFKENPEAKACLSYLTEERSITLETINAFKLGYFPKNKNFMSSLIEDYGFDELKKYGIVTDGKYGKYSPFNNRLLFPIKNRLNHVCGFGGRTLDNKAKPKYINSSASEIFNKSETLYRSPTKITDTAIINEGYMDVVSCSQIQPKYSYYAALGTALNSLQIRDVLKSHKNAVICTDGDKAGINSAKSFLKTQLGNLDSSRVQFIKLPEEQDPDEFIREHGPQAFELLIENASSPKDFIRDITIVDSQLNYEEALDRCNI